MAAKKTNGNGGKKQALKSAQLPTKGSGPKGAIDWADLFAKLPRLAAIVWEFIEALRNKQPVYAAAAHHPDHGCYECLTQQEKALVEALVHNLHLQDCCDPDGPHG
jgi:hypothetical protein